MPQETTTTQDTTGFTGAESTHIPALDGPLDTGATGGAEDTNLPALDGDQGGEQTGEQGDQGEQVAEGTQDDQGQQAPKNQQGGGKGKDRDALMQQFAKEEGLNLNDPRDRKIAQRMADKELHIRKLQADAAKGTQQTNEEDGLTEFERTLRGEQKPNEPEKPADKAAEPDTGDKKEGAATDQVQDAGASWKQPADAWNALNKAWQDGDLEQVTQVEAAIFNRQFGAIAAPQIRDYVQTELQKFLQEQLGDVVPTMRQSVAQQRHAAAVDFAVDQLSKTKGFEGIQELDAEADGNPITFNGEPFRNTPMNRILAENPWILSIQEKHADPQTAARLTNLSRYRAAWKVHQGNKVPGDKARQLVESGKKIEQRTQQDRTRQSLNSGQGAGTSLNRSQGKTGNYVSDELLALDEPTSFASL